MPPLVLGKTTTVTTLCVDDGHEQFITEAFDIKVKINSSGNVNSSCNQLPN